MTWHVTLVVQQVPHGSSLGWEGYWYLVGIQVCCERNWVLATRWFTGVLLAAAGLQGSLLQHHLLAFCSHCVPDRAFVITTWLQGNVEQPIRNAHTVCSKYIPSNPAIPNAGHAPTTEQHNAVHKLLLWCAGKLSS